jgi:hypothetical protein
MNIRVALARSEWLRISQHIPNDSPLCRLFQRTPPTDEGFGVMSINCDREEAERLLEVARTASPFAVIAIHRAINHAPGLSRFPLRIVL